MLETRKLVIGEITYFVAPLRDSMCVSVRSFSIDLPIAFRNSFAKAFVGVAGCYMDIQTKYGGQALCATSLLETDWSKIELKIQVAEKGI
ncbi:MAG TPA: hypothetical protein VK579_14880 [Terriglobales bacterium]|nr:hypothetical protein [Terriglobales bacterium]